MAAARRSTSNSSRTTRRWPRTLRSPMRRRETPPGRPGGLLPRLVVDRGAGSVLLHRLDPVQGGLLALIGLAGRDHLLVGGDEVEVVFATRALLQHELASH